MSRRLAVALAVVAVAGGVVAIGIAVHADETSPGLPPTAADAPSAPATSRTRRIAQVSALPTPEARRLQSVQPSAAVP